MRMGRTAWRADWLPRALMLFAMLAVVLSYCGRAVAVLSSPSFRVYGDDLNLLAGNAGSEHFAVRDCLGPGPEAAGEASSASYKVQIGCVAGFSCQYVRQNDLSFGMSNLSTVRVHRPN